MDTSKVSVCALLVLLGVIGAYGYRNERSSGAGSGASSGAGAGSYAGSGFPYFGLDNDFHDSFRQHFDQIQQQNAAIHDRIQQQILDQQQSFAAASNQVGSGSSSYGYGPEGSSGSSSGPHIAMSSVSLGPQGGFQSGEISPASPGIFSRFSENIDPPSGGHISVSSSSSSMHSIGPDGKEVTRKVTTTKVNDNGKITIRTVHDP